MKRVWLAAPAAVLALIGAVSIAAPGDYDVGWPFYGSDAAGTRFSTAHQIDRENVDDLEVAWTYSTGEVERRGADLIANSSTQSTPTLVDGTLLLCTPFNRLIALDPATGTERWVHDAGIDLSHRLPFQYNCRGVTAWHDPGTEPGAACATRVFMGTNDSRLIAVDIATGRACEGFGERGEVKVEIGRPLEFAGELKLTSAPAVVGNVVAVGSAIMDNLRTDAPPGTVHAFDARTGEALWQFNAVPQDPRDPARITWLDDSAERTGAANVWSTMVVDAERELIFLPTSSPSPDLWGGERPGENRYSSSIVALEAQTGRVRWHFQLVHHDIWDYDVSSPPMLIDLRRGDERIPAVVQTTKQGFVFVLRRDTGAPVFGVIERPVPQDAMPGEWLSPTQPFPVAPAPLLPTRVTPDDAWGFTFWDKRACRRKIESLHAEGIFTPPTTAPGTLLTPGTAGGMNWGGPAWDPERQRLIVNLTNVPQIAILVPRDQIPDVHGISLEAGNDAAEMRGTPYGARREWLLSPWGAPCVKPPWGELVAIDLTDGSIDWRVPLGSIEKFLPIHIPWNLGTPNIGGPIVTAGGLVFIGATMDQYLRAFDVDTGEVLWKHAMPAGTQTTPMTYEVDGRQYVVMVTGHHLWFNSPAGDEVVAFALSVNK
jgi:membrane-bound PQQ-dependent dehydrogenase (glucose/quinate/shikimate family)